MDTNEVGFVTSVRDYLIHLEGLPSVKPKDLIISDKGGKAMVAALDDTSIKALIVNQHKPLPQETFKLAPKGIEIPVGEALFGRIITPLGDIYDDAGPLPASGTQKLSFNVKALGIEYREEITEQLETGLTLVDTLIPLGKGQRELLFGEPRSGKTSFILDAMCNQHALGTICILGVIGKSESTVKQIYKNLKKRNALEKTIIVTADSTLGAPVVTMVADTALTIAEYFRAQGNEVLLALDDLGTHAKYLREVSLLSQTLPGREAYPGDIFYQHAHLLERAGNFNDRGGNGTITLLPLIEADIENFSTLIPTNLMASTDGHLLFSLSLKAQGDYPAVNKNESVTRVGRKTQHPLLQQLADIIRKELAEYQEIKDYGIFGTELAERTSDSVRQGAILEELLLQKPRQYISIPTQILLLSLAYTKFLKKQEADFVVRNKDRLIEVLQKKPFISIISEETVDLADVIKKLEEHIELLEKVAN